MSIIDLKNNSNCVIIFFYLFFILIYMSYFQVKRSLAFKNNSRNSRLVMLLLKSFRCMFEICLQFLLKGRFFKWKCLGHLLFKGSHIWLNHLKWTDCWSEELNGDSLAWDRIMLFVGEYLGSCWGRTLAAMADPSKQQKPSLLTWTSAWAACWWEPRPALPCSLASSQRSPTTIVLHLLHSQPLYLVMRLRLCDARHSRWVNVEFFFLKLIWKQKWAYMKVFL